MNQKIGIIGMGASGKAAAQLALQKGYVVETFDTRANAPIVKGAAPFHGIDATEQLAKQDLIIISPGVPLAHDMLNKARTKNIPILSELAFAAQYIDIPMLAITGTNGKSSTTWYTAQLLEQAGYRPFTGGNFGTALSILAQDKQDYDIAVVEVSSYQMECPGTFAPHAGVILNLTPDHLARHKTMESYAEHKRRIFQHQTATSWAITPRNHAQIFSRGAAQKLFLGALPGAVVEEDTITLQGTPCDGSCSLEGSALFGAHNKQNLMASVLLCATMGIDPSSLNLSSLRPLAHRLEQIPTSDGLCWINDSKATNVEATMAGVAGAPTPQILLLGGAGKDGADYTQLLPLIEKRVRDVICFGASRDEIIAQLPFAHSCTSLDEAVEHARHIARPNDTILLSPACASFDAFSNFAERGTYFSNIITGAQS